MAVVLNPRAERLLARLPRVTVYSALELLLLVLIAVQCARLFWALLTPLGPVGDYKALEMMRPAPVAGATLGSFDPFFRSVPGAAGQPPVVVTALDIRLHGVLANRATGGGSAIIATSNGQQRSFVVGEEIMPGVTLTGVGFDSITISRGGASEQLFLDQSPAGAVPNSPGAAVAQPQGGYQGPPPVPQQVQVPTVYAPPPPPPTPAANQVQPQRVQQ
jgi:general secretion pathway protein C